MISNQKTRKMAAKGSRVEASSGTAVLLERRRF
jgi:hypothetical protein